MQAEVLVFQRVAGAARRRARPAVAGSANHREGAPLAPSSWGPGRGLGEAGRPVAAGSPSRRMAAALPEACLPGKAATEAQAQAQAAFPPAVARVPVRGLQVKGKVKLRVLRPVPPARELAPARAKGQEGALASVK